MWDGVAPCCHFGRIRGAVEQRHEEKHRKPLKNTKQYLDVSRWVAATMGGGLLPPTPPRDFRGAAPLELPAGEGLLHRKGGFLIYPTVGFRMVGFVRS